MMLSIAFQMYVAASFIFRTHTWITFLIYLPPPGITRDDTARFAISQYISTNHRYLYQWVISVVFLMYQCIIYSVYPPSLE